jgi:hypothetical protein
MRYEKDGTSFEVPDKPTVRQQMAYMGAAVGRMDAHFLIKLWEGAKEIVTYWKCDLMPDMRTDIDTISDPAIVDVLIWVCLTTQTHMQKLERIPKN